MKNNNYSKTIVYLVNMVGLVGICVSLVVVFYYQLTIHELPCPLCILQRVGFIIIGFGFLFNLYFGLRGIHYGMTIIGSILTGFIASRQMFLHIMPGDTGYGSAFIGLHFYTFALIVSVIIIAASTAILSISDMSFSFLLLRINPILLRIAAWGFLLLIIANLMSTILECGSGSCADNPVIYELLSK